MRATKYLLLAYIPSLLAACSISINGPDRSEKNHQQGAGDLFTNSISVITYKNEMRFHCVKSGAGTCQVVFFNHECKLTQPTPQTEIKECTTTRLNEFVLKSGETKTVAEPEKATKYCTTFGEAPKIPECAK